MVNGNLKTRKAIRLHVAAAAQVYIQSWRGLLIEKCLPRKADKTVALEEDEAGRIRNQKIAMLIHRISREDRHSKAADSLMQQK